MRALELRPGRLADAVWVETALEDIATRDWTLLVLHDVAGACADRLDEFLTRVDATVSRASRGDVRPDRARQGHGTDQ